MSNNPKVTSLIKAGPLSLKELTFEDGTIRFTLEYEGEVKADMGYQMSKLFSNFVLDSIKRKESKT